MSHTWIDRPAATRPGEALDLARLGPYLRAALDLPEAAEIAAEQFPGGHSNLTYLLRVDGRELVLRRPPLGAHVASGHDMSREFRVLNRLAPAWPLAPRPLHFCGDPGPLGAPFYLMERLTGVILRRRPPPGLELTPALAEALCGAFIDVLVGLHGLDLRAHHLDELGRPDGYVTRQVHGWTQRYRDARTDDHPAIDRVIDQLHAQIPPAGAPALIHNDLKYDNLVLDPDHLTRVRGVLDWEMSTVGDPLMDLGTALAYWIEPGDPPELQALAFGPTAAPGSFTRRQLAERYAERSGRDLERVVFYYAFGLFKTAVVAQQIYKRYQLGHTRDPRFAAMGVAVKALVCQAERSLDARVL